MIIILKALFIIVPIIIIVVFGLRYSQTAMGQNKIEPRPPRLLLGVVLLIVGFILQGSVGQIEAGTRGVVLAFGKVTGRTLPEGLYFITPGVERVEIMDVLIQKDQTPTQASSKDLQEVSTEVTVNYRLNPVLVGQVYQDFRQNYVSTIISPQIQEAVKAVTAGYNAEELITRRADVRNSIEVSLRENIQPFGVLIEKVAITDFQFSTIFAQSIERKVVAQQAAMEAENKLLQVEAEAKQAEALAFGLANAAIKEATGAKEAAIIKAEGEALAILEVAKARAEANDLIRVTLNDDLIKYTLTQQLSDDIRVAILPAGSDFILGPEVISTALSDK